MPRRAHGWQCTWAIVPVLAHNQTLSTAHELKRFVIVVIVGFAMLGGVRLLTAFPVYAHRLFGCEIVSCERHSGHQICLEVLRPYHEIECILDWSSKSQSSS